MLIEKKWKAPRVWSNIELKKVSHLFSGKVINVSGWKDEDKENKKYKEYFINVENYFLSNYKSDARGFQGNQKNEIFLDLEKDLDNSLYSKFDVVFNHTVLEHIFDVNKAFENLCKLSNDIVIVIVPFLQEQHAEYGDYWRFTPLALKKLFERNKMDLVYINYNDNEDESIYVFAIGSKQSSKWSKIKNISDNKLNIIDDFYLGTKVIKNGFLFKLLSKIGFQ